MPVNCVVLVICEFVDVALMDFGVMVLVFNYFFGDVFVWSWVV